MKAISGTVLLTQRINLLIRLDSGIEERLA
jgi:hypothetical protein